MRLLAGFDIRQPNLVIGTGARSQVIGKRIGHHLHLIADGVIANRCWATHDIAFHIAAGRERGELDLIDPLDHALQIALHNSMMLNALPRG